MNKPAIRLVIVAVFLRDFNSTRLPDYGRCSGWRLSPSEPAKFEKQRAQVRAGASFFNGDRVSATTEFHATELKDLRDHLRWAVEWVRDMFAYSKLDLAAPFITQEGLLQRFTDISCQANGICRSQGLARQVATQHDAQGKLCVVIRIEQRLDDPQSLARTASATMRCNQIGCDVNVPQWSRDPGWIADRACYLAEVISQLAESETTLRLAEGY